MNRRVDISRGANGVDPERRTTGDERDQRDERDTGYARERQPRDYGYERQQSQTYGGFIGDHDRFAEDEQDRYREQPPRYWRHEEERERFRQGMRETQQAYVPSPYGSRANEPRPHGLPPPSRLPPPEVWRGRSEEYDFWGRERHPGHEEGHPSLWQRVKGAFTGKGPKNYVRSDERIREDVCEHLSYHPYIDASDIEVIVRDGEVTLTGTVDARLVKRAAEECCDHVRGVKDVHNHLRVRPEGQPAP